MRVLVTGATGFIGTHLVRRLISDGHQPTALLLPNEAAAAAGGAAIVRGDMTDLASLAGAFEGQGAVVHLAGAVGYRQTFAHCRRLNVLGTTNIARAAVDQGVYRFVHMSSISVYGRVPDVVLDEEAQCKKIGDPYGDTKIEAEEIEGEALREALRHPPRRSVETPTPEKR